jgi:Fe2+ transport system protein B
MVYRVLRFVFCVLCTSIVFWILEAQGYKVWMAFEV